MKKIITILSIVLTTLTYAQNVGINSTGTAPNTSAMLDVDAAPGNDKGLLIPRIALLATNNALPIIAPANSLMVYNTATAGTPPNDVVPGYYYWNGTKWIAFSGNGSANWSLTGNAGTVAGTNFIGTTDAVDFTVFTNNTEKVRVTSAGNVGIGTTNPNTALDVSGSVAFRETSLTLANGNNNDINAGNNTFITISGPSSAFSITGISAGASGRLITLYNSTTQAMTISNQSTNSIASNRIVTLTGSDLIGVIGNGGSVQLQYSASASRWIVLGNVQGTSGSRAGEVIAYAGRSAPTGYLLCDGSAVSRTTYANLFAAIDTMYGHGNGSTTFNLPDYRGYFLRGENNGSGNDPDAASRTNRGDGTAGDNVGTKESDAFQGHRHQSADNQAKPYSVGSTYSDYASLNYSSTTPGNAVGDPTTDGSNGTPRISSETRPKNINVLYCIKY